MDPTELAGVADADTMSAYAWSREKGPPGVFTRESCPDVWWL
ncbi:hypothetical protein PBI_VELVETEEN_36 [Mycobacterium phage Velveteen]|nr:hypothetical protein N858_gp036 [Mycobacterium phage Velveteen]AGT12243.1 hypothetical protein PBI_VELVETEEN_36 [Mycobacterium phage Velveteen]AVR76430.1 hypothetical protein SEA_BIGPHIL_37 [Mycobacterium phage BigPhil]QZD98519.1 hypothetical protein SEA_SARMA624_37 [Mycobacterium phage Sarma624]UVG34666.1 hypothetical protein SEA_RITA_43 [Mycobacterium phage Rita]